MNNFVDGFLSSVAAAMFIYLVRFQIGKVANLVFYKYFPNIEGKYIWKNLEGREAYPNQKTYLHLKQFAHTVKGYCEVLSGEELKRKYLVKGTI